MGPEDTDLPAIATPAAFLASTYENRLSYVGDQAEAVQLLDVEDYPSANTIALATV